MTGGRTNRDMKGEPLHRFILQRPETVILIIKEGWIGDVKSRNQRALPIKGTVTIGIAMCIPAMFPSNPPGPILTLLIALHGTQHVANIPTAVSTVTLIDTDGIVRYINAMTVTKRAGIAMMIIPNVTVTRGFTPLRLITFTIRITIIMTIHTGFLTIITRSTTGDTHIAAIPDGGAGFRGVWI